MSEHVKYGSDEDVEFLQVTLHAIYWCRYFVVIYTHLTLAGLGVNMFG